MKFTTKLTTGIAAASAAALGVGLLAFAPGIGATFTDSAAAQANINVGSLSCELTTPSGSGVAIDQSSDPQATVNLGPITSSLPSSKTAPINVKNTGDMPLYVSWNVSTSGSFFTSWYGHKSASLPQNVAVAAGATTGNYNIGATWDELTNRDMNATGTVTYTAVCSDQPAKYWLSSNAGGSASLSNGKISLNIPVGGSSGTFPGASVGLAIAAGQGLPSTQPKFVATGLPGTPGAVRLRIVFDDGTAVTVNSNGTLNGGSATPTWSDITTQNAARTVKSVTLIADNSDPSPFTAVVSCIDYSGAAEFGTGC